MSDAGDRGFCYCPSKIPLLKDPVGNKETDCSISWPSNLGSSKRSLGKEKGLNVSAEFE